MNIEMILSYTVGVLSILVMVLAIFFAVNYFSFERRMKKRIKKELGKTEQRLKHNMDGMFYLSEMAHFERENNIPKMLDSAIKAAENFAQSEDVERLENTLDLIILLKGTKIVNFLASEIPVYYAILNKISKMNRRNKEFQEKICHIKQMMVIMEK